MRHDRSPASRSMGPLLEAREFTPSTWKDFEELFRKYDGVQAGCWCMFSHREGPDGPIQSLDRQEANQRDHRALLLRGHAHGILVFREGRAIGWCQFGRREDLPRVERGRKYKSIAGELGPPPNWRITCFFVDRPFRRSGVARVALHAALESIRRRGGGIVEAYPATHGKAVATWFGTVGMFEREGFAMVRPFGQSHVLVRREIPAGRVTHGPSRVPPAPSRRERGVERGAGPRSRRRSRSRSPARPR
jgi:GNAT superfamily N-acetyltransferase